jgi:hypothetical protein
MINKYKNANNFSKNDPIINIDNIKLDDKFKTL